MHKFFFKVIIKLKHVTYMLCVRARTVKNLKLKPTVSKMNFLEKQKTWGQ